MKSKCKSCGAEVTLNTKKCPHCGARVLHPVFGLVVALVLLIVVSPFIIPSLSCSILPESVPGSNPSGAASEPMPTILPSEQPNTVLGPGTYTVGQDIDAGTYDCTAVSGLGVLRGDLAAFGEPGFVQTMGSVSASAGGESVSIDGTSSYSNLTLTDGDIFYIEMSLNVEFIPK